MVFSTNTRFGIFSMIYSMLTAYFLQNIVSILEATIGNPLATFFALTAFFGIIYNVIYMLAEYEIDDDEDATKVYIVVLIVFIISIFVGMGIGMLIKGQL